jgi:hypothetical protein
MSVGLAADQGFVLVVIGFSGKVQHLKCCL